MLEGIEIKSLEKFRDERGFFAEIIRSDWKDLIQEEVVQANFSMSYPGIVRAWHRHLLGQIDYICVVKGAAKVCAYDDREESETKGQLDEIILTSEQLQIVRIPGHYWHGTKCIGEKPSMTLYFVTKLYNYKNPDEKRKPWDDPSIIDPKTGKPYDWNKP